jgi:hypothetical protein
MEVQRVFKGNLSIGHKMPFGHGNGIRCTQVFYEKDVGKEYLFYLHNPAVHVELKPMDADNESINFEYTDEQGRFAIESVTPGTYIIVE